MASARPAPLHRRVLLIIHAPVIRSAGGRKLHQVLGWNDPDDLARQYIADVQQVSAGLVNYEIVSRVEADAFPVKVDGFAYTEQTYLAAWRARAGFHQPDSVDYHRLLAEFDVFAQVDGGAIDEVWLFAFPYGGYYESIMAGPRAFWCNAPPLAPRPGAQTRRRFVVMGFSYERGVGEMLEDLGHRAESILSYVFQGQRGGANLWERFTRYDQTHPGQAECGNVHFAPNSLRDYDWGNHRRVPSRCDAWLNFPDLSAPPRLVDCAEWGGGDIRLHHRWWFEHFPRLAGAGNGISHNWWEYVIDPNRAP
jgi:hypothetical protein